MTPSPAPNLQDEQAWLRTGALIVLATVAVGAALIYTREIMVPFVLAVFIYVSACPLMDVLVLRFKLPRIVAMLVTLTLILGLVASFVFLVAGSTQQMLETADRYEAKFKQRSTAGFENLNAFLAGQGWPAIGELLEGSKDQLFAAFQTVVDLVVNLLTSSFLVLLFVVFFLLGRDPGAAYAQVYRDIHRQVRRYILLKVTACAVTGALVWLALDVLGLELAPVFGILTFVLNFIPTVGSIVATLLPLPIALAQFSDPWYIAGVVLIPGAVQIAIGNFVEPKLLGKGLELHPATIVLALAFWYLLWGPIGMILAAPITAALRIVCMQFETTRPAAELLSGRLPTTDSEQGERGALAPR